MFPHPPPSCCFCFFWKYSVSPLWICWTGQQCSWWGASRFECRAEEESKLSCHGRSQYGHERPRRAPQHRDTHTTHNASPTSPACSTHTGNGQNASKSHTGHKGHAHTTDTTCTGNSHTTDDNTETHQARRRTAGFNKQWPSQRWWNGDITTHTRCEPTHTSLSPKPNTHHNYIEIILQWWRTPDHTATLTNNTVLQTQLNINNKSSFLSSPDSRGFTEMISLINVTEWNAGE